MKLSIMFLSEYSLAIFSALVAIIALLISYKRSNTAIDAHSLNIKKENESIVKIKSSLIEVYRYILEPVKSSERILIANMSISNFSTSEITIRLKLEIEFLNETGQSRIMLIDHNKVDAKKLKKPSLETFENSIRLKSRDTVLGWAIFNIPVFDDFLSIEEYTIKIKQEERTLSRVDFYLVKDIANYG